MRRLTRLQKQSIRFMADERLAMFNIKEMSRQITPPIIWKATRYIQRVSKHALGIKIRESYRDIPYQGVRTAHNTKPLHRGRFARIYERFQPLDPFVPLNETRLRIYNVCLFAKNCATLEGDFVSAGISFGVAPRVIYDFVGFENLGKTYHFIDPLEAIESIKCTEVQKMYNNNLDYVLRQYAKAAPIKFHQSAIPDCLPIKDLKRLAFVHLNTGDWAAEAQSLRYFYNALSPKGAIIVDDYAIGDGHFDIYDPILDELGIEPYWLPTGQCVIMKT
jgi:hypothetical protein